VIKRLLIANRGEIARRIIRACREVGVEAIAIHSDADARARHVVEADRAIPIGPAPAADSYLSIPKVIAAAVAAGADAVHPGYGFLSENPAFADACDAAGLRFVGPPGRVIAKVGSKIDARRLMQEAGVPVVPGETPRDQSDDGVRRAVDALGLPALIKASAGGGGKGMRLIRQADDIEPAVQAARREALAAFGDGTLYVERLIERPHHVEVQVFGDDDGRVVHLFERQCSVQRRHQKVIEESPSPSIGAALRARITEAAVRGAAAAGYRNAGTVEFLVDTSRGLRDEAPFYFLEMNTRLQVEHPVTEEVVGVDLVRAQLAVAGGAALPWRQADLVQRGHAIEARVYAEDPAAGFLPQAGRLALYREPRWPGVRIDSAVVEGDTIGIHYDPMIAKVIARAETRAQAIERLSLALRTFPILGIATNLPFLLDILAHPRFHDGTMDTSFLDAEPIAPGPSAPPAVVEAVWKAAAARAARGERTPGRSHDPWSSGREWRP
jgi:acetyl/propionyl-CoA carboxylase alpha subunit